MLPLVVCVVLASVGCCNPCSPHCVCASCVNVCGSWAGVAGQLEGLYPTLPLNSRTSQLCCLPCSQMYPAGMVAALPDATQKSQIPYACQYTFLWLTRGVSPLRVWWNQETSHGFHRFPFVAFPARHLPCIIELRNLLRSCVALLTWSSRANTPCARL